MTKIIGVIPARYASTRFAGKPLAKIGTKTMIQWTYENARRSKLLSDLVVATDDERISKEVKSFGGHVVMTRVDHNSGTDRIIEVAEKLSHKPDIIVNIQGDEPGIEPDLIDGVIHIKLQHRKWEMSTAAVLIEEEKEYNDVNRVKVVFDKNFRALYFSRSLIPSNFKKKVPVYRHLGIYSYETDFLLKYNHLPQSNYEDSESLEQLRALENGANIGVHIAKQAGLSVDVPLDLEAVIAEFHTKGLI